MVRHNSGFFGNHEQHTDKQNEHPVLIDVGGDLFHAAAIALIDYFRSNPKTEDLILKKVLGHVYQYFPKYMANEPYLTAADRIKRLINSPKKTDLVQSIAYVLRQITLDELYKNPLNLNYRTVFEGLSAATPKTYLGSMQTKVPASALKALEQALGLPIILCYTGHDKELGVREGALDKAEAALIIHIMEDKYYPCVKQSAEFSHIGDLALTVHPIQNSTKQEGLMGDIIGAIAQDNQRLLKAYRHLRTTLSSMDAAGELTRDHLINLYIALLPRDNNNASFIVQLESAMHSSITKKTLSSERGIINSLINTLASWVVTGAIKEEQLFEKLDSLQAPALSIK